MTSTMATDQHGQTFHDLGKHPRKELMRRLFSSHCQRMFRDTKQGTVQTGYVIRGHWLTVFEVNPWQKPV